jgi:NADH-quinone oxidoreductase subunit M
MLDNLLSLMIFLPIVLGLGILLLPVGREAARALGLAASVLVVLFGLKIFLGFNGSSGLEFVERSPLVESLGISYHLGVDGISLLVLMAAALLFPMVYLLFRTREKGYYGNLLIVPRGR